MATVIRLKRIGKKKEAHYRIVVCDSRMARDGKPIEEIGKYNPNQDPSLAIVKEERARYWLGVGAKPSDTVRDIFKREGVIGTSQRQSSSEKVEEESLAEKPQEEEVVKEKPQAEEALKETSQEEEVPKEMPPTEGEEEVKK